MTPGSVPHGTPLLFASFFAATPPSRAPVMGSHRSTETGPLKVICNWDRRRQQLILAQSVWCHQGILPSAVSDAGIVQNICFLSHLPRCLWCPDNELS